MCVRVRACVCVFVCVCVRERENGGGEEFVCVNFVSFAGISTSVKNMSLTDYGRLTPIGVAHARTRKGGRRQLASAAYAILCRAIVLPRNLTETYYSFVASWKQPR